MTKTNFSEKLIELDVPVSLLVREAGTLDKLVDSVGALSLLPDNTPDIVKEKLMAGVALKNNRVSCTHTILGFINTMRAFNDHPAITSTIVPLELEYLDYGLWELKEFYKMFFKDDEIVLGDDVINYIDTLYQHYDIYYPSDNVKLMTEVIRDNNPRMYNVLSPLMQVFDKWGKFKDIELKTLPDSVKNQVVRLLSIKQYTSNKIDVFNKYRKVQ